MKTSISKNNLLNHSEAKVQLFGSYIQKYLNIICNDGYTEVINLFDLFCGPGIYENGGEGSPIIALRKIKKTYYEFIRANPSKQPRIHCNFNDIDVEKIAALSSYINNKKLHSSNFGNLKLTSLDYLTWVDKLPHEIKQFKNEKAFIFIDPFGYKDVKAEHILKLLKCNNKVEVLLWLPIQFMYRFSKSGTPDVLDNFNSQLGINKDRIDNKWKYVEALKDGFQEYIGHNFFIDSFTLEKEQNTVFCLFFFSSHIRGYEKMLETKWEIDNEQGRGWKYNGDQMSLFVDQATNDLELKIKKYIYQNPRSNSEIYEFVLRQGFLPRHGTEVLKNLQKSGVLEVTDNQGSPARKNSFYLNYRKYKDDPRKVIFKIR